MPPWGKAISVQATSEKSGSTSKTILVAGSVAFAADLLPGGNERYRVGTIRLNLAFRDIR
jgi:hypothetical protein